MTANRLGFADLVISGGPILTMDERQPHAQCVAVRGGRITAVGVAEVLAATIGPRTEQLDLDGRTLLPGLIAPHIAEVMRRAMASGQAPTATRWLHRGSHVLRDWWVPVPSTTPASRAGILHGDDTQVVGFRFPRAVLLTAGEILKEGFPARRQKVRGIERRVARRLSYAALRGLTNVFLRATNMVLVTDAMSRGAPVIFADFVDYDEIAHHAGPERPEAMRALEGMDAVLGELAHAAGRVAVDYDFVVWSDHGQSLGGAWAQPLNRCTAPPWPSVSMN